LGLPEVEALQKYINATFMHSPSASTHVHLAAAESSRKGGLEDAKAV
jgi:hypothetical protein